MIISKSIMPVTPRNTIVKVGDLARQSVVCTFTDITEDGLPCYIFPISNVWADEIYVIYSGPAINDRFVFATILGEI